MEMSAAATAMGAVTANTQRHDAESTSQPPSSGPTDVEMADQPAHWPMAAPRSSGVKSASRMARLLGTSSAPAAPCTILAATSSSMEGAKAQSTEAAAKASDPQAKMRRRPYTSPNEPPS